MTEEQIKPEPLFADILLQYEHLIPEVVCESCQDDSELVKSDGCDTGWYCKRCEGIEVNYQRQDFKDDVLGCENEMKQELSTAKAEGAREEGERIYQNMLKSNSFSSTQLISAFRPEALTTPPESTT